MAIPAEPDDRYPINRAARAMQALGRDIKAADYLAVVAKMSDAGADAAAMASSPAPACMDTRGEWRKMAVDLLRMTAQSAGVAAGDVPAINRADAYTRKFNAATLALAAEVKKITP